MFKENQSESQRNVVDKINNFLSFPLSKENLDILLKKIQTSEQKTTTFLSKKMAKSTSCSTLSNEDKENMSPPEPSFTYKKKHTLNKNLQSLSDNKHHLPKKQNSLKFLLQESNSENFEIDSHYSSKNSDAPLKKKEKLQTCNFHLQLTPSLNVLQKPSTHSKNPSTHFFRTDFNLNSFQQQTNTYLFMNKLYQFLNTFTFYPSEKFFTKLNEDLILFTSKLEYKNIRVKPIKDDIISLVTELSRDIVQSKSTETVSFEIYGSFSTGLSIDTSDVDILIKYENVENLTEYFIEQLYQKFNDNKKFCNILPITTAKVPVLKLEVSLVDNESQKIRDISNETNIQKIKIDLTFHNSYHTSFIPPMSTIAYIKNSLSYYKEAKSIIIFLKKYLSKKKLNCYYSGGLSSYSIFILLFALIRIKTELFIYYRNSYIAPLLLNFLEFYSRFDFGQIGINLNLNYPFFLITSEQYGYNCPVILDPITNLNVGNGSYRIEDVKKSFTELIEILRQKFSVAMQNQFEKMNILDEFM